MLRNFCGVTSRQPCEIDRKNMKESKLPRKNNGSVYNSNRPLLIFPSLQSNSSLLNPNRPKPPIKDSYLQTRLPQPLGILTTTMYPYTLTRAYMNTASEGDVWMGLKCPRWEKAPIGSAGGKRFRVRVERGGERRYLQLGQTHQTFVQRRDKWPYPIL